MTHVELEQQITTIQSELMTHYLSDIGIGYYEQSDVIALLCNMIEDLEDQLYILRRGG